MTSSNDNTKADETETEDFERDRILVVGTEEGFSQKLVEYAVWFAKRMDYEVVALNCIPFGGEAPKLLSSYKDELQKEFKVQAAQGAELLAYRSKMEDVAFRHVIKFGAPNRCIRETHQEFSGFEFILAEPEACPEVDMETAIPVFAYSQ